MMRDKKEWVSPTELAQELGIPVESIRKQARDGKLPSRRFGRHVRINRAALREEVADKRSQEAA